MHFHEEIQRILSGYDHHFVDREVSYAALTNFLETTIYNLISPHYSDDFNIFVDVEEEDALLTIPGDIIIRGFYTYTDVEGGDLINIQFITNGKDKCDTIEMTEERWDYIKYELGQVIDHELIHAGQHASRQYKELAPKYDPHKPYAPQYYSNPDEIQAYAYNAAHDVLRYCRGDIPTALDILRTQTLTVNNSVSTIIVQYREWLYNTNIKTWNKFLKSTYKFMREINGYSDTE